MIKDRIILGLLAGLIGSVPKFVLNEYLFQKRIEKRRFADVVSGIFLPKSQALTKQGLAFGIAGDLVVGSAFGIGVVYLLTKTGKDHHHIKGGLSGLLGIGLFRGIIAHLSPNQTYPKDPLSNAAMSVSSALWGITAATAAVMLGDKSLFKPSNSDLELRRPQIITLSRNHIGQNQEKKQSNLLTKT